MSTLLLNSITGLTTSTELTGVNLNLYLREYPNLTKVGIATTTNANYYVLLNETTEEFRQPYVSNKLTYNPYSGALNFSGSLSGITTLSMNGAITGITSISISGRLYDGNGSYGSSSQILSSTGSAIQWINANTTNVGSATSIGINLDNTNAPKYLTFVDTSSGNNLVNVDTDLTYNPSTNVLTATSFSGGGSNLTSLTAGNLSGTIPSGVLGNSTHYIGTTAIALNRASASQSLTGINIDGSSASCTGNAGTATTATNQSGGTVSATTGTFSSQITSTQANSTTTGGGQIYLNGATGNRIDFNGNGVAAPTFTTRSAGTKLVLYPAVGGSSVDYALGIDGGTLWSSVESSSAQFKWYAGTTNIATLSGAGVYSIFGNGSSLYGPNSTWGASLRVGGNGNADTTNASVVTTNGNLHLDAASGASATLINYYKGTGGVIFGNGAGATVGSVDSSGNSSFRTIASTVATGTAPLTVASTTQVSNLNSNYLNGITATQFFNNMGNIHSTRTDFNSSTNFGFNYVQGSTNGPGIPSATQYYNISIGLGNDHAYSVYAMEFAIPRTPAGGNPYPSVRFREGGTWGSWSKIYAGYADSAGSSTNATTTTNLSGGSVAATTGTFSNYLRTLEQVRATGWYGTPTGSSYTGLAVEMGVSGGNGYTLCYNRDTSTYGNFNLAGASTNILLPSSGTTITVTGSISATGSVSATTGSFDGNVKITPSSESWAEGLQFYMPSASTWGGVRWVRNRSNYYGSWYIGWTSLDSSDDLVFGCNSSGTRVDNILRLYNRASGGARIGRDLYISDNTGGSYGNRLIVGNTDTSYTLQDTNVRPTIQTHGQYPVISLNHTVTSNSSHGPTVQFTCNGTGNQFVIGTNGPGTQLDIGTASAGDWNPHNGINNYQGTTGFRMDNSGKVYNFVSTSSPIYYDYNATGYYLDPASTSILNTIGFNGTSANAFGSYWAGGAGYPAYQFTGGNSRFGFSSTGGVVDVYADGNFYATDSSHLVLHVGNYNSYSPTLTGTGASGSWGISVTGSSTSCSGNAATATNLSTGRTNWSTNGTITAVVGQLSWKHYGNNHTIFDASNSTSPDGGAVNNTNSVGPWTPSYPTLMGWNGTNTYGVRVDSARISDTATTVQAGADQAIVNQNDGNSSTWYGRILSKNATGDKAAFLGTYASIAGVFAHNNALNAWATLYVNTTSGSDGGDVILAGSGSVAIGAASASYKLDVTGSIRATTQLLSTGNLTAWNTTTPATGVGGLHLGAASGTSNVGPAITFGARDAYSGTNAQAGIYINSDGTYGTRMYFATTDSYATGSKTAMSISEAGVVNFTRATPLINGSQALHAGNYSSYAIARGGDTVDGVIYFRSNKGASSYVGGQNTYGLEVYSTDAGAAGMSFHRGGYYAVNMGLDPDNLFRIGGWSASSNRLQMDMSGNLTMAGNVTAYSDIRLKDNIKPIKNALDKVTQLNGVTFTRNDQDDKTKRHTGVIAQEVEKVLPEVVSEDNQGIKNVAYGNMMGLMIEAIKELKAEIEELKLKIPV